MTVELDATGCPVLADARATAIYDAACPDHSFINGLRASLEASAVLAATDTLRASQTPEGEMLAGTRRVWGSLDTQNPGLPRMTRRAR